MNNVISVFPSDGCIRIKSAIGIVNSTEIIGLLFSKDKMLWSFRFAFLFEWMLIDSELPCAKFKVEINEGELIGDIEGKASGCDDGKNDDIFDGSPLGFIDGFEIGIADGSDDNRLDGFKDLDLVGALDGPLKIGKWNKNDSRCG